MSKARIPNPKVPRPIDEITREFQELSAQAANSQYTAFVHRKKLKELNERLMEVSLEAGKRQELDAENAKARSVAPEEQVDLTKSGAV